MKRSPASPLRSPAKSILITVDRLAQRRQRPLLAQAELVQPRALDEAEIRAPVRDCVERGDLPGDLDRVQRVGVESRRTDPDTLGRLRDQEERRDRGLVEQVVVDGEDVEAARLGLPCERGVLGRALVRLDPEAELHSLSR